MPHYKPLHVLNVGNCPAATGTPNKYAIVEGLQQRGHIVGMTGDGANEAPTLKKADAGNAVSGATDAARSASAIVLLTPGLSVIIREPLPEAKGTVSSHLTEGV